MKTSFYLPAFLLCFFLFAGSAAAQKLPENEFNKFIGEAVEKTAEYSRIFRNLTAEETKNFEIYDDGELEKNKNIQSDLIVYESENHELNLGEFRNIRSVDGKIIKDSEKRTGKIFAKLANAKAFETELKNLNRESSRYDEGISIYGYTLWQALPLSAGLLSSFELEEIGREQIENRKTMVVKFQQIKSDPSIQMNIDAPKVLQIYNVFNRGKVWLDLENRRILKLIIETTFDSPKFTESFAVMRQEYLYQPGQFGIYLPEKIVVENFTPQIEKSAKLTLKTGKIKPDSELQTRLTLEYKNYSRFDVTVQAK